MAVTDPYASVELYRSVAGKRDGGQDEAILADLQAISRFIDREMGGRFFTKDAAAVARTYMPKSTGIASRPNWAESENPWKYGGMTRTLYIDDLVTLTSIVIDTDADGSFADETALASTDYELLPRNAALGSQPEPYTAIQLTSYGNQGSFPVGCRVQVTGVWGWPSVPKEIERATIEMTRILRLESPRATSQINDMGFLLRTSSQAQGIIEDLTRNFRKVSF